MKARKAFVTGASEGLGRAFALRLAEEGYAITCVARNEARLTSLVVELEGEGHEILVADLADEEGVSRSAERLASGEYTLLVNNAGYSRFGSFVDASIEDELRVLKVNCGAVMSLAHAFLGCAEPGDALINLSSITRDVPTPIQPTYVATKTFVASFSESLWYQQRKRGVYVQGLCPGLARTKFIERAGDLEEKRARLLDLLAMRPERVVAVSLRALRWRRGPMVIPGVSNLLLTGIIRLMPRKLAVWLSGKVGDLAGIDA